MIRSDRYKTPNRKITDFKVIHRQEMDNIDKKIDRKTLFHSHRSMESMPTRCYSIDGAARNGLTNENAYSDLSFDDAWIGSLWLMPIWANGLSLCLERNERTNELLVDTGMIQSTLSFVEFDIGHCLEHFQDQKILQIEDHRHFGTFFRLNWIRNHGCCCRRRCTSKSRERSERWWCSDSWKETLISSLFSSGWSNTNLSSKLCSDIAIWIIG